MSDFRSSKGFEDLWRNTEERTVKSNGGSPESDRGQPRKQAPTKPASGVSAANKARLARVVNNTPEVVVKVGKPAKHDKSGNPITVSRATEGGRVSEGLAYISRNGKLEVETDKGEILKGRGEVAGLSAEWLKSHDEARSWGQASDRTRVSTSIVFSMPAQVNAEAVKDAVRSLAQSEFSGRHDYAMALHTDTKHPHVHVMVRTVGNDGQKLNLRKADLQRLRNGFAERLRQRGIEAESTSRAARGVTRKGEASALRQMRKRGETPFVDLIKREQVKYDLLANDRRLPTKAWDSAIVSRRNTVMNAYEEIARELERSPDAEDRKLAAQTRRFASSLTDVSTERSQIAAKLVVGMKDAPQRKAGVPQRVQDLERDKRQQRERDHTREGRSKGRER